MFSVTTKNLFKILFPKSKKAQLCTKLHSLLNTFETKLTVSIKQLIPKCKNDIVTVSWIIQAMESLCETHNSFKTLVTNLELTVSESEENLIYICSALKLIEPCNAFISELARLNHGNLLFKLAFSKLEASNCHEDILLKHLDSWNQHIASKNPRIENCSVALSSLVEAMDQNYHHIPKKKLSVKTKVLLRALYGVKVKTLYIFGVFAASFSGSSKNLFYLTDPSLMEELPWIQDYMEMQNVINSKIKNTFLSDRFTVIKELEAVESGVENLYAAIQEGSVSVLLMETLKKSVIELSQKFDLVSKKTDCLFDVVISSGDKFVESLWMKYEQELGMTFRVMIKSVKTC